MDSSSQVSRRDFIKAAGLGGATLAAAPAWGRVLGANDRINVALIGVGCRGNDHLELLLQHRRNKPDIEIVAICDTYQKRLSMALRKAPGAKTYAHHQEVCSARILTLSSLPRRTIGTRPSRLRQWKAVRMYM